MNEIVVQVTSRGQVTIPAEIRERLGLTVGSKVAFVVDDEGNVFSRQPMYPTIASLAGAAGTLSVPMTWKEMRRIAIEDYVMRKYGHDTSQ